VLATCALAGCGDQGKKAATRPAELFATPPAGFHYRVPDKATVARVQGLLASNAPSLESDDIAVRQVLADSKGKTPIAVGLAIDAHKSGNPDDAAKGFNESLKKNTGKTATVTTIASTKASVAQLSGATVALATKNGYVVEAIAPDLKIARVLLARLIFAADKATR
jgi:hypothetical protein